MTFLGASTKGRLEKCDVAWNEGAGVEVKEGADAVVASCT